jgi:hypothetical protein
MAMLCLYDEPQNKESFEDLHPKLSHIGYIPILTDPNDRNTTLKVLFTHIMKILEDCCPSALLATYQEMLMKWLKDCTDVTSSRSLGDDLRDRWLVNKAKELEESADIVIIIAGLSHLQRLMHLLKDRIKPKEHIWTY